MTESKFYIHVILALDETPNHLLTTLYSLPIEKRTIKINEWNEILIDIPENGNGGLTTNNDTFGLKHIREAITPSTARMFIQTSEPDDVDDTRMIEHREYLPI